MNAIYGRCDFVGSKNIDFSKALKSQTVFSNQMKNNPNLAF